jgi:epsilon-lactone hydrolase
MSSEQRAALDAMLRQAPPTGPLPVEQMRAGFAALMGSFPVPPGVHRAPTMLGERPGRPCRIR